MPHLGILGLGAALFVSTNIDDIFVLLGFFADRDFRLRQIVIGQYLGIAVLILISLTGACAARLAPVSYIGLLGIIPLILGGKKLIALRSMEADDEEETPSGRSGYANILSVAAVTIANGGDNISVYIPIFNRRPHLEIAELCATFLVLTAVWCFAARAVVNHPAVGDALRKYERYLTPFVYAGLGVYILINSHVFAVIFSHAHFSNH